MSGNDPRMEWVRRYAEGNVSREEAEQLEELLRVDAEFRRGFVEYMNLESALRDAASNQAPAERKIIAMPRAHWWRWAGAAVAALVMTALVVWQFVKPGPTLAGEVMAQVVESHDAAPAWAAGRRMALRDVSLAAGSVRLRLDSGILLDLAGPLDGHFDSPMRLRLQRGQLNADVGEHGKGFTVVTDAGEVVDLGTRFGVDADGEGSAQIAVFSGQVEIHGTDEQAKPLAPVTLAEGDAIVLRPRNRIQRLQAVMMKSERMGKMLPHAASEIIADVADNVSLPGFNCFYGVVPGGMKEGAPAYTDNFRLRWRAPAGGKFPRELIGADVLRTFLSTRHNEAFLLHFTVKKHAMVYVLSDQRTPTPEWLSTGFAPTDLALRCGPWKAKKRGPHAIVLPKTGDGFLAFSVWQREAAAGETVDLGPLVRSDRAMYGIAVKELD